MKTPPHLLAALVKVTSNAKTFLAILGLALALAPAAPAATVSWIGSNISGPADVSTTGTPVGAMNMDSPTPQTINGVTFVADPGNTNVAMPLGSATVSVSWGVGSFNNGFWAGPAPGGDTNYDDALDYARNEQVSNGTVTLGGLTVGNYYEVQLWIVDTRNCCSNRVRTVDGTLAMNSGAGPHIARGVFKADATNQVISITPDDPADGPQLNLLQLRSIAPNLVLNTNDSGPGSLRQAVADVVSGETITFTNTLSGATILLTNGQLTLSNSLTIDASALPAGVKINGNYPTTTNRVFEILSNNIVTLAGLTITNGAFMDTNSVLPGGGGIFNQGTLTLSNCKVSGNTSPYFGGGILNLYATLTIINSSLSGNFRNGDVGLMSGGGGGIFNWAGTVTLNNSMLLDNSAPICLFGGGGIASYAGTLNIYNSTFSGNSASGIGGFGSAISGGGIFSSGSLNIYNSTFSGNSGYPGGIYNAGELNIYNSTLSGNSGVFGLPGGVYNRGTSVNIYNSTFSGNSGGGIRNSDPLSSGNLNIYNSTLSSNSDYGILNSETMQVGGTILNENGITNGGTFVSLGYNLASDNGGGYLTNATDHINTAPLLAPLGNYGGPTQTMPPLPGSPAIDHGTNFAASATDQRGFARLVGSAVDIGAVETQPTVVLNNSDSDPGSLRSVVAQAGPGFAVTFTNTLSGATILLTNGQITLDRNLSIDASALPDGIDISGNLNSRVFQVTSNSTVVLDSLTIRDGAAPFEDFGGGIFNQGTLTLTNCVVANNQAGSWSGGGIGNSGGSLTLYNSTIASNSASFLGGGIDSDSSGTVTLNQSTVTGNSAGNKGGGIYNGNGSTLTMNQSTVTANSASQGGGVGNSATWNLYNSILAGNGASIGPDLYNTATINSTGVNLTAVNPLLAPLGDYGGPTPTRPPLPGSPAIDGCTNGTTFATDQRGFVRIVGAHVDIGAVEGVYVADYTGPGRLQDATLLTTPPGDGSFQFGFTNYPDLNITFSVWASTNVALPFTQWSNLGAPLESPAGSGQFLFNDPQATNYPQRFYRVQGP